MHGLVLCTFDQKESPSFWWWWWWCICPPSFSSSVAVTWPALWWRSMEIETRATRVS